MDCLVLTLHIIYVYKDFFNRKGLAIRIEGAFASPTAALPTLSLLSHTRMAGLVTTTTAPFLSETIKPAVMIKDDVCAGGEPQGRCAHINPTCAEIVDLFHEGQRIERDAVSDDVDLTGVQNPRRDQVQDVFVIPDDDGVARVRAALISNDEVCVARQEIDDLPFTLIAPLGTKYAE